MTQIPSAPRRPLVRRPVFWLILVAAILVVSLGLTLAFALSGRPGTEIASPSATPSPSAPPSTAATPPTETSAATEEPAGVAIPDSCDRIYTRDWTPEFEGLVLNPAWTADPDSGVHLGSRDATAAGLLESIARLTCKWGHPNGGSDRGLTTNVAVVDAQQAADMRAHFEAVGYSCYEEMEGVRCVVETEPTDDGQSGESHFFREGVWIATRWVNAGPDGYTHDIVTALFG